jgi:hypothetical protein
MASASVGARHRRGRSSAAWRAPSPRQGLESTYGASASIVVVLIWVYYTAQIVLFGAEFTQVRARQREGLLSDAEDRESDDGRGSARAR